jgi:hypothetical protein
MGRCYEGPAESPCVSVAEFLLAVGAIVLGAALLARPQVLRVVDELNRTLYENARRLRVSVAKPTKFEEARWFARVLGFLLLAWGVATIVHGLV